MNPTQPWSLQDYVFAVLRFKWRAAAVVVAALLLAALWLQFTPRDYESHAKLFVRVGRENAALDPTVGPRETISVNASREVEMNSIVEHLRSRSLLEKVLAVVDPGKANAAAEEKERALKSLEKRLYVNSPRASTIISVQGTAKAPGEAQTTVATLVDVYLDEHMRINRNSRSYDFFVEQSGLLKDQLEAADAELRDAKNRAGMASIEGRRTVLENQISALETQIQLVSAELAASEAKITALKAEVDSLPESLLARLVEGNPNDGLASMRDRLFQLRIREQDVLSNYTTSHPAAIAVREQVQEVEAALEREQPSRAEIVSALTAREEANRASLAVQKEELQSQLAQWNRSLLALNEDALVVEEWTRKVRQLETKYLTYVESMEEARMDQALRNDRISNVSIIQPATFEPSPVRPRKAMVLLLAFLAGSVGGVLVAVFCQHMDPHSQDRPAVAANQERSEPAEEPRERRHPVTASGGNGTGAVVPSKG
jgi:uncharacterized protein involved in exopolysaccharide biosynthesis